MQLYEQIRADIVSGSLRCGDKLPSKRTLAAEVGISVMTVEHAYGILYEEGYIDSRERSGYFVIYRSGECFVPTTSRKLNRAVKDYQSAMSDVPFGVIASGMRRTLSEYGERILIKSPDEGCDELRCALAAYLARARGIIVNAEQIVIGSGAEALYQTCCMMIGRRMVAIENPSYGKIRKVYEAMGLKCDALTLGEEGILSRELERTRATALHVTPFNSYPSGVTASPSKRREYIAWAEARDAIIIEDDFDSEFTLLSKAEDTLFAADEGRRVIYLNTFSRTIAPSFRVGYMVLPEQMLPLYHARAFTSCTVPAFEQYFLADFIDSGDFERHINRVRRSMRRQAND